MDKKLFLKSVTESNLFLEFLRMYGKNPVTLVKIKTVNFDDANLKKRVEDFEKKLRVARQFGTENVEEILRVIEDIQPLIDELLSKPFRSPQEEQFLEYFRVVLEKTLSMSRIASRILNEKLYHQSRTYFEHIKKLAKEGNAEAQKIYEDLKEGFEPGFNNN